MAAPVVTSPREAHGGAWGLRRTRTCKRAKTDPEKTISPLKPTNGNQLNVARRPARHRRPPPIDGDRPPSKVPGGVTRHGHLTHHLPPCETFRCSQRWAFWKFQDGDF